MNTKKILLAVFAAMLICAISVTGTLAYLTAKVDGENALVNTFTAAGGEDDFVETFELLEHTATDSDENGSYVLGTDTTKENTYGNVLPGTTLPKDPYVVITGKSEAPAYLYVEIVNEVPNIITYSVDGWTALNGVTGKNGGTVYVYGSAAAPTLITSDYTSIPVLVNNQVTIADSETALTLNGEALTFYAYLAQSTVGSSSDPVTVFTTCFGD